MSNYTSEYVLNNIILYRDVAVQKQANSDNKTRYKNVPENRIKETEKQNITDITTNLSKYFKSKYIKILRDLSK